MIWEEIQSELNTRRMFHFYKYVGDPDRPTHLADTPRGQLGAPRSTGPEERAGHLGQVPSSYWAVTSWARQVIS